MLPLMFGAQRFAMTAGLGEVSEQQLGVADSLGWMTGELDFIGWVTGEDSPEEDPENGVTASGAAGLSAGSGNRRRLDKAKKASLPAEMVTLTNLQVTLAVALVLTLLTQIFLVLLWRHCLNRRYYHVNRAVMPVDARPAPLLRQNAVKLPPRYQPHYEAPDPARFSFVLLLLPPCCWPLLSDTLMGKKRPKKEPKPPKFVPFPKSLMWPAPVFFTCAVFITGLSRAAVRILAAQPDGCDQSCMGSAIVTVVAIIAFLVITFIDIKTLFEHGTEHFSWKPAGKVGSPKQVGDPIMRLSARIKATFCRCGSSEHAGSKYRDRRSGAFSLPEDITSEPARTERFLAMPFSFRKALPGDAFQSREGFLLFRVNGSTKIGRSYRIIVLLINVSFGVISGLQPIITVGSSAVLLQMGFVLSLQLFMSFICYAFLPDADRVVSRIAGGQFLAETVSSAALLTASLMARQTLPLEAGSGEAGSGWVLPGAESGEAGSALHPDASQRALFQEVGFWAGLVAIGMPIIQLLEQRLITPSIMIVRNKGGDTLSLCAAAYILMMNLPRRLMKLKDFVAQATDINAEDAAGSASADAGDDEGGGEGEGGGDGGGNGDERQRRGGVSMDNVRQAGAGASKLLARAAGAKEMQAKALPAKAKPTNALPTAAVLPRPSANVVSKEQPADAKQAWGAPSAAAAERLRRRREEEAQARMVGDPARGELDGLRMDDLRLEEFDDGEIRRGEADGDNIANADDGDNGAGAD